MTFGVCIYSLAGLFIPIRLWVCLQVSVISSWRRMLGERELCVLPSGERVVWEVSLEWALGEDTLLGYMTQLSNQVLINRTEGQIPTNP